jgi:hypothetical protein
MYHVGVDDAAAAPFCTLLSSEGRWVIDIDASSMEY